MDSLDLFEKIILEGQKSDPIIWILISHQIPHIRRLADHVFFMDEGRIETEGSAQEILSRTSSPRLGQYLRSYGGTAT
jgi:ABC-type glutathione transport system ATPase component